MTFMNPALILGAAAFAIPLLIHLLNRSRFRTVEWGAMHLLESVIKVNHKRFRLDQLILLLVRCAIPALLAMTLARPVLTGARMLEGDAPVSLVVLLDTSYSMDAADPAGSRFDAAVDAAGRIIGAASVGSQIAVLQTGGRPTPLFDQPVFDSDVIVRRLQQVSAGYGASDMQTAMDEALLTVNSMSHARREIVVISDFQPADWNALAADAGDGIRRRMVAMDIRPELTLLSVGQSMDSNISVDSIQFPQRAIGVGQQLAVRATLRNHGQQPVDSVRVVLKIDGAEDSVSQATLTAGGVTQTLFTCQFDAPGSHVMEIEVVADDPLQADNRMAAAVTVWENLKVLLVDGDSSNQPLQSETDYVSIALTPFTFGRVRLSDLVQTETIPLKQLNEAALQDARVCVLANVSQLDDSQLSAVTRYVRQGGALLVTAGNRTDLNWYRDRMFASGSGPLPTPFAALRGISDPSATSTQNETAQTDIAATIVAQRFDHPALEFFNQPENGDLSTAEIRRWYKLADTVASSEATVAADAAVGETGAQRSGPDNAAVHVLLRLSSGDPLLVERQFGDGVVMQLATSIDADWTDLPLRPFFVPLMQQLVTTMASRISPPRNISTGDPAVAVFGNGNTSVNASSGNGDPGLDGNFVSVLTPDGLRRTVPCTSQGKLQVARYEATQRPGIYTMTLPSTETQHFVAETPRAESDPGVMDAGSLQSLAEHLQAAHITSPQQYLEQDDLRRNGREIWRMVLVALLAFLALEVMLQQRFAGVRS